MKEVVSTFHQWKLTTSVSDRELWLCKRVPQKWIDKLPYFIVAEHGQNRKKLL